MLLTVTPQTFVFKQNSQSRTLFLITVLALFKYHTQPHTCLVVFFSSVKDKVNFLVLRGVSSVRQRAQNVNIGSYQVQHLQQDASTQLRVRVF